MLTVRFTSDGKKLRLSSTSRRFFLPLPRDSVASAGPYSGSVNVNAREGERV
jgi:hypothetical protein